MSMDQLTKLYHDLSTDSTFQAMPSKIQILVPGGIVGMKLKK